MRYAHVTLEIPLPDTESLSEALRSLAEAIRQPIYLYKVIHLEWSREEARSSWKSAPTS